MFNFYNIFNDIQSTAFTNGSYSSFLIAKFVFYSYYGIFLSFIKCTHGNGNNKNTLVIAIKI